MNYYIHYDDGETKVFTNESYVRAFISRRINEGLNTSVGDFTVIYGKELSLGTEDVTVKKVIIIGHTEDIILTAEELAAYEAEDPIDDEDL